MTDEDARFFLDAIDAEMAVIYDKIWKIIENQNISTISITASLDALAKVAARIITSMHLEDREKKALSDFIRLVIEYSDISKTEHEN